jgi:cobaltochelatase CobN
VYVKDKYKLGTREWFEKSNPTALAQITERMIEAIRKDYWKADEQTKKELVEIYQEIANKHDVQTNNEAFKTYVAQLAQGYGVSANAAPAAAQATPAQQATAPQTPTVSVQGQQLQKQEKASDTEPDWTRWLYLLPVLLSLFGGMLWQLLMQKQPAAINKKRALS